MHPKNINQNFGYLGPYDRIIEVGDDNHMVFQEGGDVIFWIDPQERVDMKFSQFGDLQLKQNTKSELLGNLKSAGVDISIVKVEMLGQLQYITHQNDIHNKENK